MTIDPLQPGSPRDDGAKIEPQNAKTGKSPTIGAAESGVREILCAEARLASALLVRAQTASLRPGTKNPAARATGLENDR